MLLLALILLPLLAALVAAVTPSARVRPLIVAGTGAAAPRGHRSPCGSGDAVLGGWFAADPLGRLILVVVSRALHALRASTASATCGSGRSGRTSSSASAS